MTPAGGRERQVLVVVLAAATVYAIGLSAVALLRYEAFVSDYDHGIFSQYLWLLGHLRAPFNSINLRTLLGDHVEPGLVLLAPLGALGVAPEGLLVVQSIALAATAPLLLILSRSLGARGWLAAIPSLLWLVSPIVVRANLFDFHPEAFVPALLAAGGIALARRRTVVFALTVVAACSLKEDVATTYVALGVVLAWTGRRRLGLALAAASLVYLAAALLTLGHFGNALADDFGPRFAGPRGSSMGDVLRYSVVHPLATTDALLTPQKLGIVVLLLALTGFLGLAAPRWLLVAAPAVGANALSAYELQSSLAYHYWLVPAGAVALAGAVGAARVSMLGEHTKRWLRGAGACGVLTCVLSLQAVNLALHRVRDEWPRRGDREAVLAAIPAGASVSVPMQMLPHLAERSRLYVIPEPLVAVVPGTRWTDGDRARAASVLRYVVIDSGLKSKGTVPDAEIERVVLERGFRPVLRRGTTTLYRAGG